MCGPKTPYEVVFAKHPTTQASAPRSKTGSTTLQRLERRNWRPIRPDPGRGGEAARGTRNEANERADRKWQGAVRNTGMSG